MTEKVLPAYGPCGFYLRFVLIWGMVIIMAIYNLISHAGSGKALNIYGAEHKINLA